MKRLNITSVALFRWTVALFAMVTVLLLLVVWFLVFLLLGVGWAYAGTAGCHAVLNPLGVLMLATMVLGGIAILYAATQRVVRNLRTRRTGGDY